MIDVLEFIQRFPSLFFDWLACFVVSRRERVKQLLLGLPAFLVAAAVLTVAVISPRHSSSLIDQLTQDALKALEQKEFSQVGLLIDRLSASGRIPSGLEYRLALAMEERGDLEETERLMRSVSQHLVPERPQALKWLTIRLLENQPTAEDLALAEANMLAVVKQTSSDAQGHWLLAQVYVRQQKYELAMEPLELLAPYDYRASLLLLEVCKKLDRRGQALLAAKQTLSLVEALPEQEQNAESTRVRGECLFFLGRDREALDVFRLGAEKYQDSSFHLPLYLLSLKLANSTANTPEKLALLEYALELFPGNPLLLAQLSHLVLKSPEESDQAVEHLSSALEQGQSTSALHYVLGTNASLKGDNKLAVEHLRQALAAAQTTRVFGPLPPQSTQFGDSRRRKLALNQCMIKNNLAWSLTHLEPPQLEEALQLATDVCHEFPEVHSFRETRGQIHTRLKNWDLALDDLKFALEGMPRHAPLHASLSQAYEALGNKYGAQRHTRLAEELRGTTR